MLLRLRLVDADALTFLELRALERCDAGLHDYEGESTARRIDDCESGCYARTPISTLRHAPAAHSRGEGDDRTDWRGTVRGAVEGL